MQRAGRSSSVVLSVCQRENNDAGDGSCALLCSALTSNYITSDRSALINIRVHFTERASTTTTTTTTTQKHHPNICNHKKNQHRGLDYRTFDRRASRFCSCLRIWRMDKEQKMAIHSTTISTPPKKSLDHHLHPLHS